MVLQNTEAKNVVKPETKKTCETKHLGRKNGNTRGKTMVLPAQSAEKRVRPLEIIRFFPHAALASGVAWQFGVWWARETRV